MNASTFLFDELGRFFFFFCNFSLLSFCLYHFFLSLFCFLLPLFIVYVFVLTFWEILPPFPPPFLSFIFSPLSFLAFLFWCFDVTQFSLLSPPFLFFFTLASFLLLLLPCFLPTVPHSPSLSPTTSFPWCPSSRWHSRASAWSSPCHGCVPAVPPPASPSSSPSLPRHHAAQSQPQW